MADKKTIVVIGAGPGLGNAIARRFGREGYRAVLMARRQDALEGYVAELAAAGIEARGVALDVTDEAAMAAAFADVRAHEGTPDVVAYNVGITSPDPEDMDTAELRRHFEADLFGAFSVIREVADNAFAEKKGAILLTGGVAAVYPFPGYDCLAMTKAALRNLAQVKNRDLAERGIFVGTVMVCGVIGGDEHFAPDNIAEAFWKMNAERAGWEAKYE